MLSKEYHSGTEDRGSMYPAAYLRCTLILRVYLFRSALWRLLLLVSLSSLSLSLEVVCKLELSYLSTLARRICENKLDLGLSNLDPHDHV